MEEGARLDSLKKMSTLKTLVVRAVKFVSCKEAAALERKQGRIRRPGSLHYLKTLRHQVGGVHGTRSFQ